MCIFCIAMLEPLLMSTLRFCFPDNISISFVHYMCYTMLVLRFEPQGRRFTNFHYYYLLGISTVTIAVTHQKIVIYFKYILFWAARGGGGEVSRHTPNFGFQHSCSLGGRML